MSPASDLPPRLLDAALSLLAGGEGRGTLPILGRSMEPTLPDGSEILVDFSARALRPGDLAVFRQNQDVVVHRYLGRGRSPDGRPCLRTRGDGLLALDPPCPPDRLLGRVVRVRRDGSWWDLENGGARAYARALAWHDLFWAALGALTERATRERGALWRLVRRADRALLRRADASLFRRAHRGAAPPSH
jgi:hypothetical protein